MSRNSKMIIIISIVTILAIVVSGMFFGDEKTSYKGVAALPIEAYKININTADLSELTMCPDLGEKTAESILDFREKHGAFNSIYELSNIKGIGEKSIEKWEDYLCAE